MDNELLLQLPPLPADIDGKLIAAFWEFTKLSNEDQDIIAEHLKLLTKDREEYEAGMKTV